VTSDELVFLIPSLAAWRRGDSSSQGPAGFLQRVLAARARATAALIARHNGGGSVEPILRRLASDGFVTQLAESDLAGDTAADTVHLPDDIASELATLALIDRVLHDAASGSDRRSARAPLIDWPPSLADVLAASAATRINAAYVYPEYAYAHELLSFSAVLGILVQRRAVYFPPALAAAGVDALVHPTADVASVAVLRSLANLAGGADRLLAALRRCAASPAAQLILPGELRHASSLPRDKRETWNAQLAQRLDTPAPSYFASAS
jgi:putative NIF3 family GTP cyclohydrolase 1 type 2